MNLGSKDYNTTMNALDIWFRLIVYFISSVAAYTNCYSKSNTKDTMSVANLEDFRVNQNNVYKTENASCVFRVLIERPTTINLVEPVAINHRHHSMSS